MKKINCIKLTILLLFIMSLLFPTFTFSQEKGDEEMEQNPNFQEVSVHDPSIIKENDTYYVFGTHIEAAKSTDLMNWETFTNGYTTPDNKIYGDLSVNLSESFEWAGENDADSKGGFAVWAPEVIWNESYINNDGSTGAYMMYYSVSSTYMRSAIGYAVSQEIEGPYEYVDTIVYSGFTEEEDYDGNSDVNKQWENTNINELIEGGQVSSVKSDWFLSNGDYNNTTYPNAIDANLFYDENGKLWMTYGSWSGGIFMLEIDQETGAVIYPKEDGLTDDGRMIDRYFGTHIAVGYWKSGEGPYVVYDEGSGYYYLYVTYGYLDATGGYNMRQFRAKNPEGPYVDATGESAVLSSDTNHELYGNKLISNYLFKREPGEPGTGIGLGYVSPGHNSVYIDPDTNEQFLVFHSRFPEKGESHQLRIHQMVLNRHDWPVVLPHRYAGGSINKEITEGDIIGEYKYINHQKDNSDELNTSQFIHLNEDQTISGAVQGTWSRDDHLSEITINGVTYDGVFVKQWDPMLESEVTTFTALSNQGISIWGSKVELVDPTDKESVAYVKENLKINSSNVIVNDIELPTEGAYGTNIAWESSNQSVLSDQGVVTSLDSDGDYQAILTAKISKNKTSDTKEYKVTVQPDTNSGLTAYYPLDGNLMNKVNTESKGSITGDRIDNTGGKISYEDGKYGQSASFDGASGIRLPDGLISSDTYTVSLWLKPEKLTDYTTAFFGAVSPENWISLVPKGHEDLDHNAMIWSGEEWYDADLNSKLPVDEWSHVAFSVEKDELNVYLNGTKEFTGTGFPNIFNPSNAVFSLGVNYWDKPYKGLMDDVLVYDGQTLSEEEIMKYYSERIIPGIDRLEEESSSKKDPILSSLILWITLVISIVGIIVLVARNKKKVKRT